MKAFKRTILSFIMLLIIAGSVFIFCIPVGTTRGDIIYDVTFDMKSDFEIELITINNFTFEDAQETRAEIDDYFGNNDGIVSETEVEGYRFSFETGVKDVTVTENTYFDRVALKVLTTTVQILNGTGLVNSTAPVQIQYHSRMEPLQPNSDTAWHRIVFLGTYYGNYSVTIKVPEGWAIDHDPINFEEYSRSSDDRKVSGKIIGNFDVKVKLYNPSRWESSDSSSDADVIFETLNANLIIIVPMIIAIIVLLFYFKSVRNNRGASQTQEVNDNDFSEESDLADERVDNAEVERSTKDSKVLHKKVVKKRKS
jgi:hypothetical protein